MSPTPPSDTTTLGQAPLDKQKAQDDDLRCWSVTTIIGALDKPALVYWAATETAKAAVEDLEQVQALAKKNPDDAVEWLSKARFRTGKNVRTAAELGTAVHEACEQYALTGIKPDVDDEVQPFLNQFDQWAQTFQPSYQATEVAVYSPTYGYAGTCDAFLTLDGVPLICDYKTTRKSVDGKGKPTTPYPEVALQLAAYRYADLAAVWRPRRMEHYRRRYYLLSPAEQAAAVPVPEVEGGVCIHITPGHCEAYPIVCDEDVFERYLHVTEAARWQFELSKTVIGEPLQPPVGGPPDLALFDPGPEPFGEAA
jgi:hypothetical protein